MLKLSALAKMSEPERGRASADLIKAARAPRNGQATGIDSRIRVYEEQYGMDSATMRARFAKGEVADTQDISSWLMLLSTRGRGR